MQELIAEITLSKIKDNYLSLRKIHHNVGVVVKANAYGLGMVEIAPILYDAGARIFFVATLSEGIELRKIIARQIIYVFNGIKSGEEDVFNKNKLRPVANTVNQVKICQKYGFNFALHIDTGMNRLGISSIQASDIPHNNISLIMSHLACSSISEHPLNKQQLDEFLQLKKIFPNIPFSLSNSAGIFLGKEYHFDIVRAGCALYGISPFTVNDEDKQYNKHNPLQAVTTIKAPILQIKNIEKDGHIGYSALISVKAGEKYAIIGYGYADGLMRHTSPSIYIGNYKISMAGRISMDMSTYNVSHIPDDILVKAKYAEIIGKNQTIDHYANICNTIGYEIFTNLGNRVKRKYVT